MAKLYATLENSKGKKVSLGDNESIMATVYDGNKKAYSVIIEWGVIGDYEHGLCLDCGEHTSFTGECEHCGNTNQKTIEVIPAVKGAIVMTREWRNQPDERRKEQLK